MASQSKPSVSVDGINIQQMLDTKRAQLARNDFLSPTQEASTDTLILFVSLLANRLNLNSSNRSKPSTSDLNRIKPTRRQTGKKPGGQLGHEGSTLQPCDDPEYIKILSIHKRFLSKEHYDDAGFEAWHVVDIETSRIIIEYRAQALINDSG